MAMGGQDDDDDDANDDVLQRFAAARIYKTCHNAYEERPAFCSCPHIQDI